MRGCSAPRLSTTAATIGLISYGTAEPPALAPDNATISPTTVRRNLIRATCGDRLQHDTSRYKSRRARALTAARQIAPTRLRRRHEPSRIITHSATTVYQAEKTRPGSPGQRRRPADASTPIGANGDSTGSVGYPIHMPPVHNCTQRAACWKLAKLGRRAWLASFGAPTS